MPDSFRYTFTDSVVRLLTEVRSSLWVSTYQAGKLAVFRPGEDGARLSMLLRTFDKAMGLALDRDRLAIGTRHQIWFLQNAPGLAPKIEPKGRWEAVYLPRRSHVSGNIDIHELGWGRSEEDGGGGGELWAVNTLYSALCTFSPDCSFVPRWQPPFITDLRKHDRCHLNGMALENGRPAFVTAFAETDTPNGWREDDHRRTGGVVIDVASGETVARGLSMPHSPRLHGGKLWVLDSGNGRLTTVDPGSGDCEIVAELPGYTRGLAFLGRYALVGLSRIRESSVFGGIPIAENPAERKCGVWIVDTETGDTVGAIEFEETVDEIFDVQVLPGILHPWVIGNEKDSIEKHCIIGPARPV